MDRPEPIGDAASEVARELQQQHLDEINQGIIDLDEESDVLSQERLSIFSRITFRWHTSDQLILSQLRAASQLQWERQLEPAFAILDQLYAEMRIPEQSPDGVVLRDQSGRPIWKKDPDTGLIIETTEQLTGQDLEKALLDLHQLKMTVSEQTNHLLSETMLARYVMKDKEDDLWDSILEGTINDRQAKVGRETRQEKYHYFFHWLLYTNSQTFLKEIISLIKTLGGILDRRIYSQR
jgi:hypothetical protein